MSAEQYYSIECTIPLANVHPTSLHLLPPRDHGEKLLFPLQYQDSLFSAQTVTLSLPPLKLKTYSAATHLLEVYADSIVSKLQTLQESILGQLTSEKTWLATASLKSSELQQLFQPILKHTILTVFLHPKTWIFKAGSWKQGPVTEFSAGCSVQLVLRLQGLQVLPSANPGKRVRIQHQTLGVICI
jgi:hypothetical protein